MVRGVRRVEGRGVAAAAQEVRGVQGQGPASPKRPTMPPSMGGTNYVRNLGGPHEPTFGLKSDGEKRWCAQCGESKGVVSLRLRKEAKAMTVGI
jgi:hypothetical protein